MTKAQQGVCRAFIVHHFVSVLTATSAGGFDTRPMKSIEPVALWTIMKKDGRSALKVSGISILMLMLPITTTVAAAASPTPALWKLWLVRCLRH